MNNTAEQIQEKMAAAAAELEMLADIQVSASGRRITFGMPRAQKKKCGIFAAILLLVVDILWIFLPFSYSMKEILPMLITVSVVAIAFPSYWFVQMNRRVVVDINGGKMMLERMLMGTKYYKLSDFRKMKVYSMALNGKQPTPNAFFLKIERNGKVEEVFISDLNKGQSHAENYWKMRDFWRMILSASGVELSEEINDDVEFEVISRKAKYK